MQWFKHSNKEYSFETEDIEDLLLLSIILKEKYLVELNVRYFEKIESERHNSKKLINKRVYGFIEEIFLENTQIRLKLDCGGKITSVKLRLNKKIKISEKLDLKMFEPFLIKKQKELKKYWYIGPSHLFEGIKTNVNSKEFIHVTEVFYSFKNNSQESINEFLKKYEPGIKIFLSKYLYKEFIDVILDKTALEKTDISKIDDFADFRQKTDTILNPYSEEIVRYHDKKLLCLIENDIYELIQIDCCKKLYVRTDYPCLNKLAQLLRDKLIIPQLVFITPKNWPFSNLNMLIGASYF